MAHISSSVAWLGAVLAFLALALAGLNSTDAETVRSAYAAMALIGWYVIVPFSLAALVTGFVQSVGTEWGLFRQYWIVVKLLLTVGSTILLPLHLRMADRLSATATSRALGLADLRGLRVKIAADAAAAAIVLLMATVLSVYKPWGAIAFASTAAHRSRSWGRYALMVLAALVLIGALAHLTGSRFHTH